MPIENMIIPAWTRRIRFWIVGMSSAPGRAGGAADSGGRSGAGPDSDPDPPRSLDLPVNLGPAFFELLGLFLEALLQRPRLVQALLRRVLAHVLGDLHRADVGAAHRAKVGELGALSGEGLVVEGARGLRGQRGGELVLPAELEACR